jgi:hypothetical protein
VDFEKASGIGGGFVTFGNHFPDLGLLLRCQLWPAPANPTFTAGRIQTRLRSFTNALVTVTLTGDTANVTPGPVPYTDVLENPGSATVSISGFATATFTDSIVIVSTLNPISGFEASQGFAALCYCHLPAALKPVECGCLSDFPSDTEPEASDCRSDRVVGHSEKGRS